MDRNKIDSTVLAYYMNRIYGFLTSPRTSQVFPGLTKDVEDILVEVAGQDDLKLQGFDDDFKASLSKIRSELERKKGEYRLSCDFQELSCGTRSLTYKKNMLTFKQPQPLRKPNSMSNIDKQPPPALSSDLITQSFKLRCLNATLKFIKDDSRMSLRYPEMATVQAQHIVNMFEHSDSDVDVGLGYKTLYAPLWEAMKIFGLKYKFTLKYTEPKDKVMKCLVLDKIPIIVQATKNKENQDQNAQNFINLPDENEKNTSKISLMDISDQSITDNINSLIKNNSPKQNKTSKIALMDMSGQSIAENIPNSTKTNNIIAQGEKFKKPNQPNGIPKLIDTIKLLGDDYITDMYKYILDFIMDDELATLTFHNKSLEETQVLINWNRIMNNDKYVIFLSGNCLFILSQLGRNYKNKCFSITVNEGKKKSKADCRRDITFVKVPYFGKENPKDAKQFEINKEKRVRVRSKRKSNLKRSGSQTSLSSLSSAMSVGTGSSARQASASRASARQDVSASQASARRDASASQTTAIRSSVIQVSARRDASAIRSSASQATSSQPTREPGTANKIKIKLLEGLDQPVTSDKAMKMMMNMGWEGGALGARGDGIVEPIRPTLDCGKRYGLGAPIEEPKPKTTESTTKTKAYHMETLNLILNLLTSPSNSKEITFPVSHMRKEWNYIKNVVILFNKGLEISASKNRAEVINKIMDIMYDTDWLLTAGLKNDRITIVIKKSILPLFPNELKLYCEIAALTESRIYNDGSFKDIYKGLRRNVVKKPAPKDVTKNTKENVKNKKSCSTELTRSVSTDQNKIKVKIEALDKTPALPQTKDLQKITDDFKNNVLANMLLFCQTDIQHKYIKFGHILVENQRTFIKECIEKVNMNTSFMERNLETRFYEQIIAAMDGFKIVVIFSSPDSINLEKEYPHYELTVKNTNNNVTIHYYDEDIESDGETKDDYLDPEQSFVDDDVGDKLSKTDKGDDFNNNVQHSKFNVRCENNNVQEKSDVRLTNNNVQLLTFDVNQNNNVQEKRNVLLTNNNVQSKCNVQLTYTVQNLTSDIKHENMKVQDKSVVQVIDNDFQAKSDGQLTNKNVQIKSDGQLVNSNVQIKTDVQLKNNNVQNHNVSDSDDEIEIIIEEDDTVLITSGDESDLLKSDSEDDLSINKILTKLNDYKTSSLEKSAQVKLEKIDNLERNSNDFEKEILNIKVEKDFENSNTLLESSSGKRSRTNSQNSIQYPKRVKLFCKQIAIVPENYPVTKMADEKAREIQILLLDAINNHSELPLIKCHGIKNGTLIYNCYTENTFVLMENIVAKANLKIIYEFNTEKCFKKMAFRITTYIEEPTNDILNRLVKFNEGLNIEHWTVIKKEQKSDFVVIYVNIDNKSYSYLKDSSFSLYAGVDVALFTHVWD